MSESPTDTGRLVGIEVRNSGMIAVCLEKDGSVKDTLKTSKDESEDPALHLGSFVSNLKEKFGQFDSVGLAVPGLINQQTRRVAYSTHIHEHTEINILGELERLAGVRIHIENDANAAAYGEYHLGAGRGSKDMFYVTLGEGVGGALIFDNELWHGDSGFAGEFGYVAVNSEGLRLEDLASAQNIIRRTKDRFHQDPTSSLNEIGEDNITLSDIVREAQAEDDFAQLMLERTGLYVGTALAGVINLLNVEKIVIGGKIMEAGHLVLDAITARAKELSFAPSFETVEIVEAELGEKSSAIGVALLSDIQ